MERTCFYCFLSFFQMGRMGESGTGKASTPDPTSGSVSALVDQDKRTAWIFYLQSISLSGNQRPWRDPLAPALRCSLGNYHPLIWMLFREYVVCKSY